MTGSLAFWLAAEARPTFRALRLDAGELELLARRRLGALLRSAARTSFYAEQFRRVGIDPANLGGAPDPLAVLAALPPISKRELREAGDRALVGGRVGAGWRSSLSSGSTGEPFRVHYAPRAWATLKYLVKLRARRECGVRATDRIALLDAVPGGGCRITDRFRRISALRPAEDVAAELAQFAPDVLSGLPSALLEVGNALRRAGAQLPVRSVFTGGELLQRSTREALESAYGARVFDVYGTSETKEIAWECRLGGMHVNADVVHVEALDDTGAPAAPGNEGDLVATVLVNHAMPLLRYRTGDRGTLLPGRCSCGRATPLLGVVTGREAETLTLAGGQRVSPYALTCALEQVKALARYQVTQLDPARLRVRAIVEPGADRSIIEEQVRAVLRDEVAAFLVVQVEFVDHLPTGPRAKFRVVERQ